MGMNTYPIVECFIEESKLKDIVSEKYKVLSHLLEAFDVQTEALARALHWSDQDEFYEEADLESASDILGIPTEKLEEEGFEIVEEAFRDVQREFKRKTNVDGLDIIYISSDADIGFSYMWTLPLILSRPLRDAGADVIGWTEWG